MKPRHNLGQLGREVRGGGGRGGGLDEEKGCVNWVAEDHTRARGAARSLSHTHTHTRTRTHALTHLDEAATVADG